MLKTIVQLDRSVFYAVNNQWSNPFFDAVMPFIRNQYSWVPLYLFLLVFVFINFRSKFLWWLLFALATFALTDLLSAQVVKELVQRPRPCVDVVAAQSVRMLIPCSYSYSFVSSHATNHFGLAVFLFASMKHLSKAWIWLLLWAALISFAQIYVGAHFPLDVLAGAALGCLIGHNTARIFNKQFGGLQLT
ncbi:MAG: phosphatase PAP2 family protein [Chitinophagaceae bacterium]|jgi:membrane-associated phospholipid phosphatase|nr:phosphatase PAP2 family protein [Chitinophagaceae bacterium]